MSSGHNILFDSLYIIIFLADLYLQQNITMLGIIMANRKDLGSVKFLVNYRILSEKTLRKKKAKLGNASYVNNITLKSKRNIESHQCDLNLNH